ncbi:MAG: sensor histidine kinase [Burkholderiaceae bacterium]
MRPFQFALLSLWRILIIGTPVAMGCAWFFSTMLHEPFHISLIYSLCIGWLIQALIDTGRYVLSYRQRKNSPGSFNAQHLWPGWILMTPWILASGIVGYLAGYRLGDMLTGVHRAPGAVIHNMHSFVLSMAVVSVLSLGCVYFFYSRGRIAILEAHNQAAMRTAAESQLKMLESQLEPHMLFNTLAHLRVLIGLDPPRAQEMLDRMISFLRATLEASRTGSHPLSTEVDRIHDYLDMMQVRMGQRLQFQLALPTDLAALPVPPLLMQPLVENSIKHGLEPKIQGGRIEITARREGDALILSARDTGIGLGALASKGTNFGMQQVRERIGTLYGSAAKLELVSADDKEGGTLATIHLPMSKLILPPTTA